MRCCADAATDQVKLHLEEAFAKDLTEHKDAIKELIKGTPTGPGVRVGVLRSSAPTLWSVLKPHSRR